MGKSKSFSQCAKCAVLQRKFESTLCPVTRLELLKERASHNQRQMLERKYYYSKRQASKQYPDEFLSLIIDGMDQSKTDLPHFVGRQAKSINPAAMLKTHITGVISHGHGMFASFLDILQYPHDPNLTINVILSVLQKISQLKGELPPVFYLQMDNSPRDNKNVMGFCEALVRLNVFNEVHISFLYVGHSHKDIDASFSKISEKLRKSDAETVPALLDLVVNMELLSNL
ncbi:uncharacterized protein LOC123566018 [Mercenaria mercenaria]|uniref:uncharacterized protein LOC123566018 n=1 Tax=Mercenaria mercenaria TaxID=6596 RepID=UPI00234F70BC|nr:uncharacterized protein LOC123566018 [Mercenaria mercenaria]